MCTVHSVSSSRGIVKSRTGISLLYIDDSPSMLELIKIIFEKDYRVDVQTCQCPKNALQILLEQKYDLIISDYDMLTMDGIQLLDTIRSRGLNTPFILYTCHSLEEIKDEIIGRDSVYYVHKWGSLYDQIAKMKRIIQKSISFSFQEYPGMNLIA